MDLVEDMNGCCGVAILRNFGAINWSNVNNPSHSPTSMTFEGFRAEVLSKIRIWDSKWTAPDQSFTEWQNRAFHKMAVVLATTSSAQISIEGFLEALGFNRFGPVTKIKHSGSKLSVWTIEATNLMKAVGYKGWYDRRRTDLSLEELLLLPEHPSMKKPKKDIQSAMIEGSGTTRPRDELGRFTRREV